MSKSTVSKPTDNRRRITSAAFQLFRECGYRLTSYSKIAERSEMGRPLVQYYFPKKEDLATEFVLSILDEASRFATPLGDGLANPLVNATRMGHIYYSFLLGTPEMRRLTLDLLASRQVTSRVTIVNAEYTIHGFPEAQSDAAQLRESSIRATGGIYEIVFAKLETGQQLDPAQLSMQNTAAFAAFALGKGYDETIEDLVGSLMDTDEVERICVELSRRIFG